MLNISLIFELRLDFLIISYIKLKFFILYLESWGTARGFQIYIASDRVEGYTC